MIDKVLAESDQPIVSVASRRGALAGLLAGVAGVQTVRGRKNERSKDKNKVKDKNKDTGSDKARTESKKRKGKGKGRGRAQPPTVIHVENSNNVTGTSGLVSGLAECPSGFVAIGGGFTVISSAPASLVAQELGDTGREWIVRFNVPTAPVGSASIDVTAICLKATLEVGA